MDPPSEHFCASESETRALGAEWGASWKAGDLVLLEGDLGAGKTTFVRGVLEGRRFEGAVRSPTFNLMHVYETEPPILHVDLYRLPSAKGLGLEDYLESHLVLVEWPDRAPELKASPEAWRVEIVIQKEGRRIRISEPAGR